MAYNRSYNYSPETSTGRENYSRYIDTAASGLDPKRPNLGSINIYDLSNDTYYR